MFEIQTLSVVIVNQQWRLLIPFLIFIPHTCKSLPRVGWSIVSDQINNDVFPLPDLPSSMTKCPC